MATTSFSEARFRLSTVYKLCFFVDIGNRCEPLSYSISRSQVHYCLLPLFTISPRCIQVHIATAFNDAPPVGRVGRARIAILEVGISVFGAALTTMGSAVFLFGAVLLFFRTFGVREKCDFQCFRFLCLLFLVYFYFSCGSFQN